MKAVSDIQQLIRVIAVSSSNFSFIKSMIVEIEIWDGRTVRGSKYEGSKKPEIISIMVTCLGIDGNLLWSHVKTLLKKGESFIVRVGPSRDACLSEWTISSG